MVVAGTAIVTIVAWGRENGFDQSIIGLCHQYVDLQVAGTGVGAAPDRGVTGSAPTARRHSRWLSVQTRTVPTPYATTADGPGPQDGRRRRQPGSGHRVRPTPLLFRVG